MPRLTFGDGATATHRYFPDKLPIGISNRDEDHVFVYLVTSPVPMDFRVFLLRHAEVLRGLYRWTIRVLVPVPFASGIRLFGHAARETLATPLPPSNAEVLRSVFLERQRRRETPDAPPDPQLHSLSQAYGAPRFRALFRAWQQLGDPVIWSAQSYGLRDALQRGEGRVEFVKLTHQYLPPLVARRRRVISVAGAAQARRSQAYRSRTTCGTTSVLKVVLIRRGRFHVPEPSDCMTIARASGRNCLMLEEITRWRR